MEDPNKTEEYKPKPVWISSRKLRRLKLLYSADPETAIREVGGVISITEFQNVAP